jgi:hypothetical protein
MPRLSASDRAAGSFEDLASWQTLYNTLVAQDQPAESRHGLHRVRIRAK